MRRTWGQAEPGHGLHPPPPTATIAPAGDAAPSLTGAPGSSAGFGALLTGAGERTPADALTLAAIAAGEKPTAPLDCVGRGLW